MAKMEINDEDKEKSLSPQEKKEKEFEEKKELILKQFEKFEDVLEILDIDLGINKMTIKIPIESLEILIKSFDRLLGQNQEQTRI